MIKTELNPQPMVYAVILNWNQPALTLKCLHSASMQDYERFEVVVVDNGSADNSTTLIKEAHPDITLIENEHNLGFAKGVNIGIRHALVEGADAVVLINNDATMAHDCISNMVAELATDAHIGMITAKIYLDDDRQRIWNIGGHLQSLTLEINQSAKNKIDDGQFSKMNPLDFVPLCGVLITRPVFEQVGLLDEEFFVYYEDMDYCQRVREAGFKLHLADKAMMWHAVSMSSGGRESSAERYWMAQGSGRYFRKHAKPLQFLIIVPYRLASALRTTLRLLRRGQGRAIAAYWLGLVRGWASGTATAQPPAWVTGSS